MSQSICKPKAWWYNFLGEIEERISRDCAIYVQMVMPIFILYLRAMVYYHPLELFECKINENFGVSCLTNFAVPVFGAPVFRVPSFTTRRITVQLYKQFNTTKTSTTTQWGLF